MGIIVNTAASATQAAPSTFNPLPSSEIMKDPISSLVQNSLSNAELGSRMFEITSQLKDVSTSILRADIKLNCVNGAIAMLVLPTCSITNKVLQTSISQMSVSQLMMSCTILSCASGQEADRESSTGSSQVLQNNSGENTTSSGASVSENSIHWDGSFANGSIGQEFKLRNLGWWRGETLRTDFLEARDMMSKGPDFLTRLQKPISFNEFGEHIPSNEATDELKALAKSTYKQLGALDFQKLVDDNLLKIEINQADGLNTPISVHQDFEKVASKLYEVGQHDESNRLNGVGRRIRVCKSSLHEQPWIFIWEGQYRNGLLDGFARRIQIKGHGDVTQHIGSWKKNQLNGQGQIIQPDGSIQEGIFENGQLLSELSQFDTNNIQSTFKKNINFQKYLNKEI